MTPAELADTYPPLPPDRNGAKILNEAFDLMERNWGRPNSPRHYSLNLVRMPRPWEPLPDEDSDAIAQFLANKQEVFRLIENGLDVGQYRSEIDFTCPELHRRPQHLSLLRNAVRMFGIQAARATANNDANGAAVSMRDGIRLAECLRQEPLWTSQGTRLACHRGMAAQIARWLCWCQASPSDMAGMQTLLTEAMGTAEIARAFAARRCRYIHFYRHYLLYSGKEDRRKQLFPSGHENDPHALVIRFAPEGLHRRDLSKILDVVNRHVAAWRLPYPESLLKAAALHSSRPLPSELYLLNNIVDALTDFQYTETELLLRCVARLECARMALAVERFRSQNSRLPTTLREVVPRFAAQVATDPFCGAALQAQGERLCRLQRRTRQERQWRC